MEAVFFERRDPATRPPPDPARCFDCPVDPALLIWFVSRHGTVSSCEVHGRFLHAVQSLVLGFLPPSTQRPGG